MGKETKRNIVTKKSTSNVDEAKVASMVRDNSAKRWSEEGLKSLRRVSEGGEILTESGDLTFLVLGLLLGAFRELRTSW